MPSIVVVGAGPGIGQAVARRFAREGYAVALVARRADSVVALADELSAMGAAASAVAADAGSWESFRHAWASIVAAVGNPEVLVYNAAAFQPAGPPTGIELEGLVASFRVSVAGALAAAQLAVPAMRAAGRGTVLFTGGGLALAPVARAAALSIGKAGIRSLAFTLAEELGPEGIHTATVTVCGAVAPGTAFDPDDIADVYWQLHAEPQPWTTEVVIDGQ